MAANRNFTKVGVTDLFTKYAKQLFPSTSADKRYIQLSIDQTRIATDARFLGFTDFNEATWKPYLLPQFVSFKLKAYALYQICLMPADVEIVEITEASLDGVVEESAYEFSLVRVTGKGLVAVPGCFDVQTPCKLVRNAFIEVEASQPSSQLHLSQSGGGQVSTQPTVNFQPSSSSVQQPGQAYAQSQSQQFDQLSNPAYSPAAGQSYLMPPGQASSPPADQAYAQPPQYQGYPQPLVQTFGQFSPQANPQQLDSSQVLDPANSLELKVIVSNQYVQALEYDVDISQVDVEEYPKTCGERRLPIYSLKNTSKWNQDLQLSVNKLAERYSHWRRSRGDGNCYYRAVAVAYLEHLARRSTVPNEMYNFYMGIFLQTQIAITGELAPYVKNFVKSLYQLYQHKSQGPALEALQQLFKDPNFDLSAVATFRCIARASVLKLKDDPEYSFFFTISTGISESMRQIESMGTEAEGFTFMAMAAALNAKIIHWTVKGADCRSDEFGEKPSGKRKVVISLLLKPGHYDVLYPLGAQLLDNYSFANDSIRENCKSFYEIQDLLVP